VIELLDRRPGPSATPDGPACHECLETSDQRSQLLSGVRASLVLGRDPVVFLIYRPVAVAWHVDRRHRETILVHEPERRSHDAGGLLVLAAAVSHQDKGSRTGGAFWSPQHAGDLTEGRELFGDAAGRRLEGEAHSVSSLSGCLLRALPP
jgi:hypothetical protein